MASIVTIGVLVALIVMMVVFIYILLLGQSEYHKNGIVGSANRFLTTEIPKKLDQLATRMCSDRIYRVWNKFAGYCFFSRNPFLQIFYLALTLGGLSIFMFAAFPRLPLHHQINTIFISVCTMTSFLMACFADPGKITKENHHKYIDNYPFDGVVYRPKECRTCHFIKPARSKHCSLCNMCVARYDHHCPWLNTCVGAKNIRWFITFLFFTTIFCAFGTYYSLYVVWYDVIIRYRMLDMRIGNAPLPYTLLFQYIMYYGGPGLFGLCIMGLFAGLAVLGFLFYHLYLIGSNKTTQESFRWSNANYYYEAQEPFRKEIISRMEAGEKYEKIMQSVAEEEGENEIELLAEPINIYQRGFIKNLYEVFVPLSTRSNTSSKPKEHIALKIKQRDDFHKKQFPPFKSKTPVAKKKTK